MISTFLIGWSAALQLYLSGAQNILVCITVAAVYFMIDSRISVDVYHREVRDVDSYLLGVSAFMGLYAFDMKGIIYGPLLVCLFFMIFEILKSLEDKN